MINARWYDFPLGNEVRATRDEYLELAEKVKSKQYPEIDNYEKTTGFAIDKKWLDELALHTQIVIKKSELCYAHGRVLYSALSEYLNTIPMQKVDERITIWETGTALGFSSLCMAKALQDQKRSGLILTFDVLPHKTPMYWNCIDDLNGPRSRAELLEPWKALVENYVVYHQGDSKLSMPKVEAGRVHFAFLDGAHTYEDVMFEFEQVRDNQLSGDIIVYDDYTPDQFPGLVSAVDEITNMHGYDCIKLQGHSTRGYAVTIKRT